MRQNMLLACVGTVVRSTILCCPRVRGSFVFVVAFVFPGGSAESSYTSASASVRGLRSPDFSVPFVQLRLCMLGASVGKPVQSLVFCCPRARGSLVFFVAPFCIRASFLACSSYPTWDFPVYGQVAVSTLQWSRLLAWSRAVLWSLGAAGSGQFRALVWGTMSPSLRAILARRSSG